ncbi:hypothetical protein BHE74_00012809 [Ensete ventricosum]|uniref:Vacuolar protein sorting-associated protein 55 homolog n=1 Tax=Ensete ventricosum TaxID=4639 RepID=A0A427A6M5_ENSVE|nr:hypothetical protein B296_00022904 [Ensete ventricosum]RWW29309.1 hypothetical protein GW17_00006170 [Ensete ventricosum]RWW78929.1 hypothetical protein BHE74_00012809 [Ensete ventricosum]RZR72196.1 hypothetical protein BHM03_00011145 [Ensete ventricosum]
MAGLSRSLSTCLHSGQLALLAILVSGGIVLQILVSTISTLVFYTFSCKTSPLSFLLSTVMFQACALYNNWWPMLTGNGEIDLWVNFTKFLTGASVVGSIAIPSILKHANLIGWGALAMELSSFVVFGVAILWFLQMSNHDDYSYF